MTKDEKLAVQLLLSPTDIAQIEHILFYTNGTPATKMARIRNRYQQLVFKHYKVAKFTPKQWMKLSVSIAGFIQYNTKLQRYFLYRFICHKFNEPWIFNCVSISLNRR